MGSIWKASFWEDWAHRVSNGFLGKRKLRVLLVGLDGAGKTTILYKLKDGGSIETQPTPLGDFNLETVVYKDCSLDIWDIGGPGEVSVLWRHYFWDAGVIFVVDSLDRKRLSQAQEALHRICEIYTLENAPVIILANKQEAGEAMSIGELEKGLDLQKLSQQWAIRGRLEDALDWLTDRLKRAS